MKESFLIYKSFYEPIKSLPNDLIGQIFRNIFEYQIDGVEPDSNTPTYMVFQFFKNQFRLDEQKYQKVVNRNRANGLKGGRKSNPKNPVGSSGSHWTPKNPKGADNDNDNDNEKDNDKDNDNMNIHPQHESGDDTFDDLVFSINLLLGKKYKGDKKSKGQHNARLKEGYSNDQIIEALEKAMSDSYHISTGYKYLTPEFITRQDKIEKFLNS